MAKTTYTKSPVKTTKIQPEFSDSRFTNYGVDFVCGFLFTRLSFEQVLAEQLALSMGTKLQLRQRANIWIDHVWLFMRLQGMGHFEELSEDLLIQNLWAPSRQSLRIRWLTAKKTMIQNK